MLKVLFSLFLLLNICFFLPACSSKEIKKTSIYDVHVTHHHGEVLDLSEYAGKVILIFNIAVNCGTTQQLHDIKALYSKYKSEGLVVLAFPSLDYAPADPKDAEEVAVICQEKYGIEFPVLEQGYVAGKKQHGLFSFLTVSDEPVVFNFEKFLINKQGLLYKRYGSFTGVKSPKFLNDLNKLLNE